MNVIYSNLAIGLITGWLASSVAGISAVMGQAVADDLQPAVTEQVDGQTLVCRKGDEASEFLIFRQNPDDSLETEAAYMVKAIRELGECNVFIGSLRDYPRFHIMALPDKSILVFRNNAGRRYQYPSYSIQPETGKSGCWSVYQAKATVMQSSPSATIEIDDEKKITRVSGTKASDENTAQSVRQIYHADLVAPRGFRVRGLSMKSLTGVISAVDLLESS